MDIIRNHKTMTHNPNNKECEYDPPCPKCSCTCQYLTKEELHEVVQLSNKDQRELVCDHQCSSDCRRKMCNCDCGDWHQDKAREKHQEKATNTQEDWEKLYPIVALLVEKMREKYPPELNMEGLEPALTQDILEIVCTLLAKERAKILEEIERRVEEEAVEYLHPELCEKFDQVKYRKCARCIFDTSLSIVREVLRDNQDEK